MFGKKKNKSQHIEGIVVEKNASTTSKTEGYQRLKDNILYLNADGKTKVISVESSLTHEGKTTVACNLAVSLGFTDKKVLIIDLDFRRPKVHRVFKMKIDNGVADYMLGNAELDDIIKKSKYDNVDVITRGSKVYNSSLVLVSDKFKEFINTVKEKYDYVFLDCAPVLQVSDYIHISQVCDGVIFLVAYGITTRAQVSEAVKELRKCGANILGSVFSMYDRKKSDGYYRYYRGYYKGYYNYYSHTDEKDHEEGDEIDVEALTKDQKIEADIKDLKKEIEEKGKDSTAENKEGK